MANARSPALLVVALTALCVNACGPEQPPGHPPIPRPQPTPRTAPPKTQVREDGTITMRLGMGTVLLQAPWAGSRWNLTEILHGILRTHVYRASSDGEVRQLVVYTPPGYDPRTRQRYPVLYLLHGSGGDETSWSQVGGANLILDVLIAAGEARPMLVVMPNGHPVPGGPRQHGTRPDNTDTVCQDLVHDILPLVESLYRVRPVRGYRAIAGLSMGGGQALRCGAGHLEEFAWVGAFSAAVSSPGQDPAMRALLENPDRANEQLQLLWIAIGRNDLLLARNQDLRKRLDAVGIEHTFLLTDGEHDWAAWRDSLARFAPQLFRD